MYAISFVKPRYESNTSDSFSEEQIYVHESCNITNYYYFLFKSQHMKRTIASRLSTSISPNEYSILYIIHCRISLI